ncbi:MAG: hypothetical protein ACRD4S_14310 [Candidatus Acidiferrales bacterium]
MEVAINAGVKHTPNLASSLHVTLETALQGGNIMVAYIMIGIIAVLAFLCLSDVIAGPGNRKTR